MECILETKAATILEFLDGLRGSLSVTFEEGSLCSQHSHHWMESWIEQSWKSKLPSWNRQRRQS